jgi:hypothetical protein
MPTDVLQKALGGDVMGDALLDEQKWYLQKLARIGGAQLGAGVPAYQGQIAPDANMLQQQAFRAAPDLLYQQQPGLQSAIQSALAGPGDFSDVNRLYRSQLSGARDALQDELRGIEARYGDTWGQSGALPAAVSDALQGFGRSQTELLGGLTYQDRQNALQRQLAGIGAAQAQQGQRRQDLNALLGIGSQQYALDAAQNAEAYQKWFGSQAYNNPWLRAASPILGTQAQTVQELKGIVPGVIGTLQGLASVGGSVAGGGAGGGGGFGGF